MRVKSVVLSSLLSSSLLVSANASGFKTGYYLGAMGSYSYAKNSTYGDLRIDYNNTVINPKATKTNQKKTILGVGVVGGYRKVMDNGFVVGFHNNVSTERGSFRGVVKYGDVTVGTALERNLSYEMRIARVLQVSPSLVLGKVINNNFMLFSRVGLSVVRFATQHSEKSQAMTTKEPKRHVTNVGYQGELGVEFAINPRLSLMGSVSYEWHNTVKVDSGKLYNNLGGKSHIEFKPRYVNTVLGVVYKF